MSPTHSSPSIADQRAGASSRRIATVEFLATILRKMAQPFLVVDANGVPVFWNRALEELTGYSAEELPRIHAEDLMSAGRAEIGRRVAAEALKTDRAHTWVSEWCTKNKQTIPVEISVSRLDSSDGEAMLLVLVKDLSERERLESELRQSQKMEGIGRLAGGIAHDFNNVLTTILGLTDAMIHGHTPPNSESLREIQHAARHAAELTHHLLAFSRRQILQMRNLRLDSVVQEMTRMLGRLIGEDIRLDIHLQENLPPIRGDRSQLEQVLLNLCLNSRDAMPKGGDLRIEVAAETLTEDWCRDHPGSRPGNCVRLTVRDTGEGMDEETLRHLFEPFFTRKEQGKGTGLGLSMVYGIVKQHDGFVTVESKVGRGTEFSIYFPASSGEVEAPPAPASVKAERGSATVLVVEDEKSVRRLILEVLPKLGYRVFTAADGEEAIKVFDRYAEQIQVVLLDAILPKLGSRQVYEHIRERKPDVRFVFTSGYNEVFINKKFELDPSFLFLPKPFTADKLASMLRSAVGR